MSPNYPTPCFAVTGMFKESRNAGEVTRGENTALLIVYFRVRPECVYKSRGVDGSLHAPFWWSLRGTFLISGDSTSLIFLFLLLFRECRSARGETHLLPIDRVTL